MFWRIIVNDKGGVALITALCMPFVIASVAFGVEVSYWRYDQVRLQQAADAAAYAGAVVQRSGIGDARSAALAAATSDGYSGASDTLTLNTPSTTTPNDANSVEVALTRTETPIFVGLLNQAITVLHARATASYTTAANACILALSHGASGAINFAGSTSVTLTGCTVMSNSIASDGLNVQGSAQVTAPCMYVVGGANLGGAMTLTSCSSVQTQQPPVADPYSALTMPTVSGSCQNQSNGSSLSPGHYCSLKFNKGTTLSSGVYIVDGGSLTVNGGATVTGAGVTFYLVNGASVSINGNADLQLSAPTSGADAGFLFISDRSNTGSISINGDNSSTLTGVIYAPDGGVSYSGNFSGSGGCTQIVAQTVSWSGNSTLQDSCSAYGMSTVQVGGVVRISA
jgi:Flp pilus assembly protein TadG